MNTDMSPCKKVWLARAGGVAEAVQEVRPGMGWSGEGGATSHLCTLSDTTSEGSEGHKMRREGGKGRRLVMG